MACRLQPASGSLGVLLGMAGLAMLHTERRHAHNTHANTTNVTSGQWHGSIEEPSCEWGLGCHPHACQRDRCSASPDGGRSSYLGSSGFCWRPAALPPSTASSLQPASEGPTPSPIVTLHCMASAGSDEMYVFGGGTFSQVHGRLGLRPIGLHTYCTVPPFQPRTWPVP